MYTMDNNGFFASGFAVLPNGGKMPIMWTKTLEPYTKEPELRLCPMATKPSSDVFDTNNVPGSKFLAWGKFDSSYASLGLEGVYGSYGMNGNVSNDPPDQIDVYGQSLENNWRRSDVRGANNIPYVS